MRAAHLAIRSPPSAPRIGLRRPVRVGTQSYRDAVLCSTVVVTLPRAALPCQDLLSATPPAHLRPIGQGKGRYSMARDFARKYIPRPVRTVHRRGPIRTRRCDDTVCYSLRLHDCRSAGYKLHLGSAVFRAIRYVLLQSACSLTTETPRPPSRTTTAPALPAPPVPPPRCGSPPRAPRPRSCLRTPRPRPPRWAPTPPPPSLARRP
jgi:hypothetical protein